MASCKECVHADMCRFYTEELAKTKGITFGEDIFEYFSTGDVCEHFKDRSRFVELPCKIGTELFRIKQINGKRFITNTALNSNTFWDIVIQGAFGKTVFLTREEAEQALKEREEN